MDLYSQKASNKIPQIILVVIQMVWISISILIYASVDQNAINNTTKLALMTLIILNIISFIRFMFAFFVFIKRKIPLEELFSVSIAFGIYYLGFLLLARNVSDNSKINVITGILFFIIGSLIHSISELQRHRWKSRPENKGKIFTLKLFSVSRHPNYFGDVLWVTGYAIVSGNIFSFIIPLLLFIFFTTYNIPMQEKHMKEKYKNEYVEYCKKVKSIIPHVL